MATGLSITSGKATVIATGSAIPFKDRDLELSFTVDATHFGIVITTVVDQAAPGGRWEINTDPNEPLIARLRLINIHAAPISGVPEPIRIWSSSDTAIYLQLRHVSIMGMAPVFNFTIYLEPEPPPTVEKPSAKPEATSATPAGTRG